MWPISVFLVFAETVRSNVVQSAAVSRCTSVRSKVKDMKKQLRALFLWSGSGIVSGCGGGSSTPPPPPPPPSLAITSTAPPPGTTGAAYNGTGFQFTAAGGVAPYHWKWTATSGFSLPTGLDVSAGGLVSGTPTAPGDYRVIVTVLDSESPSAQVSAEYPINIDGLPILAISSGAPPTGTVGISYGPTKTEYFSCIWSPVRGWHLVCTLCPSREACASLPPCGISRNHCRKIEQVFLGFTVTAIGGMRPYTFSASGLPPGLTLDAGSGRVLGMPTAAGSYNVTFTGKDGQTPAAEADASHVINIINSGSAVSPK